MEYICPIDGEVLLSKSESFLTCSNCNSKFRKDGNLISFLKMKDDFYEGAYLNRVDFLAKKNSLLEKIGLWTINSGYLLEVKNNFKFGDNLLELGCAGGVSYFGREFKMIGCDLSLSSLEQTKSIYHSCIQASPLEKLPLPNNCLDGVISSFFWEHLNSEEKKLCLKEIYRVLKPGGKIVFLYDIETSNPMIKFFQNKNLQLYKDLFLDCDGHIGYASISENLSLMENNKFSILKNTGLQKTFIQEPSVYLKFEKWGIYKVIFSMLRILTSSLLLKPFLFFVRIIDVLFNFLPDPWSRITLTTAKVEK